MDVQQIIGDYKAFFSDILVRLTKVFIDIEGMPISHLCYRVTTIPEYEKTRDQLKAFCAAYAETRYNERPISMLLLKEPLVLSEDYSVSLIELPAPRTAHTYQSGLEHVGIIVGETLPRFKELYKAVLTGEKDRGPYCQPAFITFDNGKTAKFYERSLQEALRLEMDNIPPKLDA